MLPDNFYYGDRIEDESLISTTDLNKRIINLNKILENFWQRWNKEYVLELRNTHRNSTFKESNINIGDMVLVHDENQLRGFWKTAKIQELIRRVDDIVRGAILKIYSSNGRTILMRRPIQKLYPLEVSDPVNTTTQDNVAANTEVQQAQRPRRIAASNARELIRIQSDDT